MQAVKLQNNQELKVWERLVLIIGDGASVGRYIARIEDFINNGIVISRPEHITGADPLRGDTQVVVQVTRDDAAYEFTSQLTNRRRGDQPYCILTPPRSVRRVQRRLFCRIQISSDVYYQRLKEGWTWDDEEEPTWQNARSIDASAGGMLLRIDEEIARNAVLLLKPELLQEAGLPDLVIAVCRRAFTGDVGQCAGVEFILARDIPKVLGPLGIKKYPRAVHNYHERSQDRLSHFLFDLQIEQRKRGAI